MNEQKPSVWQFFNRGRTYLPIIGALYTFAIIAYAFVWIVDPYNLRPWGVTVKLADHPYIDRVTPLLFSVAAHDGSDVVIVGGSTSMLYTKDMMREAFPEAKRPVNLSFFGPTAREFKTVLDRLEESQTLKRILLSIEWTYAKESRGLGFVRNENLYKNTWSDPVPEFNLESIQLSAREIQTGIVDLSDWKRKNALRPDEWSSFQRLTDSPKKIEKIAKDANASRGWVAHSNPVACEALPYLRTVLLPFVTKMAARGVSIDLIMPPYSIALYSDWSINRPFNKIFPEKGASFANMVSLRRCIVEMTSDIENVHVHAFDTDLAITGNLSRYWDTAHILDQEAYREIILRIAKGDAVLTPAKWPEYERALTEAVQQFKP